MPSITEQLHQENANYDPHGFKSQGATSPKHAFGDTQVAFSAFPQVLYRDVKTEDEETTESKIVTDSDSLKIALADGWRETPKAKS